MIERFITILLQAKIGLDYRQIEEVLWLSGVLPAPSVEEAPESPEPPKPPLEDADDRRREQQPPQSPETQPQAADETRDLYTPSTATTGAQFSASRVRVPAAAALPEALLISRALRPLSRRVKSKYLFTLDEDATVEQSARSRMITPVFTPAAERWFDVALVVEDAPSMVVWRQTIRELAMLLERQGAFRDVRQWRLRIESGKAQLIEPAGAARNVKVLNDPNSRRLVVLLSDCASPRWRDGSLAKVLLEWGAQMPVVIGHMLSERLWRHTATGEASVTVASMTQGAPNRLLEPELPWWDEEIAGRMPFPIISLNHELIGHWARMLTSVGAKYKATLLPIESGETTTPEPSTAEERVDRFRSVVSNEAYDLAVFLSVMPLTLPVIRLVHQAMIRNARQEQLAEVLLGQVIRRKTPPDEQRPPEEIEYEFYPEVPEILQGEIQYSELDRVFQSVSSFIGRRIGSTRDFVAWIKDSEGDAQIPASSLPFAEIAVPALERMGLANLLKEVETDLRRVRRKTIRETDKPGESIESDETAAPESASSNQSIESPHQTSIMESAGKAKVLVIDDDPEWVDLVKFHLESGGYEVITTYTGAQGLELIAEHRPEIALTDLRLPDVSGTDLIAKLKEASRGTEVIMITAFSTVNVAIEAIKAGAFHFIEKTVEFDELMALIERGIERGQQVREIEQPRGRLHERDSYYNIIGSSRAMRNIYEIIENIAESDASVMIIGESGTGKELIANAIHYKSARSKKPFVKINCSALPIELIESELFGHAKGVFSDSPMEKMGLIGQATGGSLFLDEIGEMPIEVQPKLIHVLRERVYYRVGSEKALEADFRLISATNRNPLDSIHDETLRKDLFFLINAIEIQVPPLRDRAEDAQRLAEHFLRIYADKYNRQVHAISQQAYERMFAYSWPGNVRELQNVMERAVLLARGEVIEEQAIPRPKSVARAATPTFTFKTATLDERGKRSKGSRRMLTARYLIEDLADGVTLEMVEIPGGKFLMGSPESEADSLDRERPQHEVTVPTFYIGKKNVTQAQWRVVAGWEKVERELKPDPSRFKGGDRPVENVNWEDAKEFCARLAKHTGRLYRLPSEAEWEYACRSGTTTPFAFGETITPEIVNYNGGYPYAKAKKGEYRGETVSVGSLGVANAFGLFDMHGNVWEWCEDVWHGNYNGAPTDGSAWLSGRNSSRRMLRGGSFDNNARFCRSAYRVNDDARNLDSNVGFRVVVSARTS